MIKAVFFDIDQTLFHFDKGDRLGMEALKAYAQEKLDVSPEDLLAALSRAQQDMMDRLGYECPTWHNRQLRYQNAMALLNKPIYPHATAMYKLYWNAMLDSAEPEPGVTELIAALKDKGIYLGVGSDMTSYIQNQKLERLELAPYFDAVVTSEEAGMDKPNRPLFELCLQKAGCAADEAVFIGDNYDRDIAGAVGIGMHPVWYTRHIEDDGRNPQIAIDSYLDCVSEDGIKIANITI